MRGAVAIAGVGLAAVWLWLWSADRTPSREETWSAVDTSFSSGPRGLRGVYLLFGELGLATARLRRPAYEQLGAPDVLWLLSDRPLGPLQRDWVEAFVRRGGTLVASPLALGELLERLGVGAVEPERREGKVIARGLTLDLERHWAIEGSLAPERVWAREEGGAPVVASWRSGQGRVVVCGIADAARNGRIGKGENGLFFAHLAFDLAGPKTRQLFDELHAGYGDGSLATLVAGAPWALALAQLALALGALLWAIAPRRRPIEPGGRERRRATRDHVEAVAALWARAGDAALPLERILAAAEERARARLGENDGQPAFARWIAQARPELASRAQAALERCAVLVAGSPAPDLARLAAAEVIRIEGEALTW